MDHQTKTSLLVGGGLLVGMLWVISKAAKGAGGEVGCADGMCGVGGSPKQQRNRAIFGKCVIACRRFDHDAAARQRCMSSCLRHNR